jgi:hypothetical protein
MTYQVGRRLRRWYVRRPPTNARLRFGTEGKLSAFEPRCNVSIVQFLAKMSVEDLVGGDLECVDCAGEAKLLNGLRAEMKDLEDAQYRFP